MKLTVNDQEIELMSTEPILPMDGRMKPIIILPTDTMTAENIEKLNANGLCVVEANNPALVKFLDPIPSAAQRTKVEQAAISLSRMLLNWTLVDSFTNKRSESINHRDACKLFVDVLLEGTPLDKNGTYQEREEKYFNEEKRLALSQLAREEAREERKAAKEKMAKEAAERKAKLLEVKK